MVLNYLKFSNSNDYANKNNIQIRSIQRLINEYEKAPGRNYVHRMSNKFLDLGKTLHVACIVPISMFHLNNPQ